MKNKHQKGEKIKAAKFARVMCDAEYKLQEIYHCKKNNDELWIVYDYEELGKVMNSCLVGRELVRSEIGLGQFFRKEICQKLYHWVRGKYTLDKG